MSKGTRTIILNRRAEPTKNGDHVFRHSEGLRASVYVNKRIFIRGHVPDNITLTTDDDIFRLPHNLDPDATARRVETLEAKAEKKRAQADAMLEKARELGSLAEIEAAKLSSVPR